MEQAELEQIIEQARLDGRTRLDLSSKQIYTLPSSIGSLFNLRHLCLRCNQLNILPDSIANLSNLTFLDLGGNRIINLPKQIFALTNLTELHLYDNYLEVLPDIIGNFPNLIKLTLLDNQLIELPDSIGNLENLIELLIQENKLTSLPSSINKLYKLKRLDLSYNQLTDLSILQELPNLDYVDYFGLELPRRYLTKFSKWKAEWLLDEDNAEIRRLLIKQLGYENICEELGTVNVDTWREYTLLKIDGVEAIYNARHRNPIDREPLVLLKMTCPSTQHIHILRVPPEMVSAEAAITWVNHGIHPDRFAVQT